MDADQSETGLYRVQGAVATITLPSPALTGTTKSALVAACRRAASDTSVRAVVLTGTGTAFCVGQDLAEHAEALRRDAGEAFATLEEHYHPIVVALTGAPKPVVAAVNGTCAGAGLALALACDVRIAAAEARFVTAFTSIGLTFDSGLSATLARAVGMARASELMLVPDPFTADQALAWGLIGRVAPAGALAAAASELAARLAAGPTLAYAATKRALMGAWGRPITEVLDDEREAQTGLGSTPDHAIAVEAFLSKQTPRFTGRDHAVGLP